MQLDQQEFVRIIDATPLVSIDLVVRNEHEQVLLGYRRNRPAQGYWFVPGGRIRKNECSQDALQRIAQAELGVALGGGRLLGAFDHLYEDNFFGIPDLGTHYVVLAYECRLGSGSRVVADDQHADLKWWDVDALLTSSEVHDNTKLYFRAVPGNGFRCDCA